MSHERNGGGVTVVGEVKANGSRARETGRTNGGNGLSVGQQFEAAADDSLRRCAATLLEATERSQGLRTA